MICKADIARRIVEMPLPMMRHAIVALRRIGEDEMANALSRARDEWSRECAHYLQSIEHEQRRAS